MPEAGNLDTLLGQLACGELPWEEAWTADFSAFAERFTLHDSYWIGLFLPVAEVREAILAIKWDAHWLPEPVRTECLENSADPLCPGWPFLFMRISDLQGLQLFGYEKPLCGGEDISGAEYSVEEGIKVLEIENQISGTLRLEYTGQIEFLALRQKDCQILDLAMIEPRPEPAMEPAIEKKPWWRFW